MHRAMDVLPDLNVARGVNNSDCIMTILLILHIGYVCPCILVSFDQQTSISYPYLQFKKKLLYSKSFHSYSCL